MAPYDVHLSKYMPLNYVKPTSLNIWLISDKEITIFIYFLFFIYNCWSAVYSLESYWTAYIRRGVGESVQNPQIFYVIYSIIVYKMQLKFTFI